MHQIAQKSYSLLKANPQHPSLHFKKLGNLWTARIGLHHRALAVQDGADFIWVWIGSHEDYDRMISSSG
ncbi:MAG: hypothetical protein BZ151_09115 [Desulfobacca sp. 4484_104]|nr:MAG: hypothetical protein BZ151_09115 [Desulfobacca sp. 4484_104]RLA91105.1 MAG: hypothetical protein DRG58_00275 [Deltaproteobacteria bacterium]